MNYYNKKLRRLPKYYKEYLDEDMLELADKCKNLYDVVSNKDFAWDIFYTDRLLFDIKYLINKIDI